MASAVNQLPDRPDSAQSREKEVPWAMIAWVAALVVLAYLPVIKYLVQQWISDEDMGHGFFVPVVAAYIAWTRREDLAKAPAAPNYWGLAIIAWGAAQLLLGTVGAELFLQRTALIITIVGCIVLGWGMGVLRILAFPVGLLVFMVPIPRVVYTQITFPLQLLASRVAESMLSLIGIPVLRDGNVLELASQKLSVVEACSGIRSLLSLSFLSLVYAFFFDQKPWMRWVLLVLTVPIAITANAGRVTITGILSEIRPDLAQGFSHEVEGWLIFIGALAMLILVHRLINIAYSVIHARNRNSQPA
jgi:exosortase